MSLLPQHIPSDYHELTPLERRIAAANAVLGVITALASGGAEGSQVRVADMLADMSPLIDKLQDAINVTR